MSVRDAINAYKEKKCNLNREFNPRPLLSRLVRKPLLHSYKSTRSVFETLNMDGVIVSILV